MMRGILISFAIIGYLFSVVYIESQLVKIEIRKERLKNQVLELKNEKKELEFKLMEFTNLARIEVEAKAKGFIFPTKEDILGVIK